MVHEVAILRFAESSTQACSQTRCLRCQLQVVFDVPPAPLACKKSESTLCLRAYLCNPLKCMLQLNLGNRESWTLAYAARLQSDKAGARNSRRLGPSGSLQDDRATSTVSPSQLAGSLTSDCSCVDLLKLHVQPLSRYHFLTPIFIANKERFENDSLSRLGFRIRRDVCEPERQKITLIPAFNKVVLLRLERPTVFSPSWYPVLELGDVALQATLAAEELHHGCRSSEYRSWQSPNASTRGNVSGFHNAAHWLHRCFTRRSLQLPA